MLKQIIEATEKFFGELFPHSAEVVSIIPTNEGWEVLVEVVTDDEYTKKRARNDLISVFKVSVNNKAEILSYIREEIRERGRAVEKVII